MKTLTSTTINELEAELKELGFNFYDLGESSIEENLSNGKGVMLSVDGETEVTFEYDEVKYEEGFPNWYGPTEIRNVILK